VTFKEIGMIIETSKRKRSGITRMSQNFCIPGEAANEE
jgi:hypothetical protein